MLSNIEINEIGIPRQQDAIEHHVFSGVPYETEIVTEIGLSSAPEQPRLSEVRRQIGNFTRPSVIAYAQEPRSKERQSRGIQALSIVIPALNEEHYLPSLLDSLVVQQFTGDLQVVVVDGQSEDRTVDVAKSYSDRLAIEVVSSDKGVGRQRNAGAGIAKHEHLLFLDSDVILPPEVLNKLASRVNPRERVMDNVVLLPHPRKPIDTAAALAANLVLAIVNKFEPTMTGAFILTTKDNHEKVGGFREGAIIGEDLDYAMRSVRDGAKRHMHTDLYVLSSSRRADEMGRLKFTLAWARAYLYVRRHGPIYKDFEYPYGHYRKK